MDPIRTSPAEAGGAGKRRDSAPLALLLVVCALLFFAPLGAFPFYNKGEPREALVVQSLLQGGNWLFPLRPDGELPSKPPLFHWVAALSSLAAGTLAEWSVRFPSALFATLGVVVAYLLGRQLFDPSTGLWSGIILATLPAYQWLAISARVDMTLGFFLALALALFYSSFVARAGAAARWRPAFYCVLGLSILAKGPVSLVLVVAIGSTFFLWRRRGEGLGAFFSRGMLLALALPLAWYALALFWGGEPFWERQIVKENLERFFVRGAGGTGHQKAWYYYFPYLFSDALPWSLFFPLLAVRVARRLSSADDGVGFLVCWVGVTFVFLSLSAGKRPDYLLPLYPPLAILLAKWFAEASREPRVARYGLRVLGGITFFAALPLLWLAASFSLEQLSGILPPIQEMLKSKDRQIFELSVALLREMPAVTVTTALTLTGILLLLAYDLWRLEIGRARLELAAIAIVAASFAHAVFLPSLARAASYAPFVAQVKAEVGGSGLCLYSGGFDPNQIVFYWGRLLPKVTEGGVGRDDRCRFIVMSEEKWRELSPRLGLRLRLRSFGLGPDWDTPLVLVEAGPGGREKNGRSNAPSDFDGAKRA